MGKLIVLFCSGLIVMSVPVHADNLIMKDGTEHEGKFISGTSRVITFREGGKLVRYNTQDVDAVQFNYPDQNSGRGPDNYNASNGQYNSAVQNNSSVGQRNYPVDSRTNDSRAYDNQRNNQQYGSRDDAFQVVPSGTELVVRTNEIIDSERAREGQTFAAQIDQDVLGDSNQVIIPRGSSAQLTIKTISSGGVAGTPEMALGLQSIVVRGRNYLIDSADLHEKGTSGLGANKRTGEMVGGGALLGTIIGAIAGGGKGAAIGALGGAAAGGGAEVLTKGKVVRVPAEAVLRFRLDNAIHLHSR
jgi:hypothetical protein